MKTFTILQHWNAMPQTITPHQSHYTDYGTNLSCFPKSTLKPKQDATITCFKVSPLTETDEHIEPQINCTMVVVENLII